MIGYCVFLCITRALRRLRPLTSTITKYLTSIASQKHSHHHHHHVEMRFYVAHDDIARSAAVSNSLISAAWQSYDVCIHPLPLTKLG